MKLSRPLCFSLGLLLLFVSSRAYTDEKASAPVAKFLKLDVRPKSMDVSPSWVKKTKSVTSPMPKSVQTRSSMDLKSGVFVPINIVFKDADTCNKFECKGLYRITHVDRFGDYFALWDRQNQDLDADLFKVLNDAPEVISYEEVSEPLLPPVPHVPPSAEITRAPPDQTALGGVGKYTGKGVVVAVIDSGIDYHHPDFVTKDAAGKEVSRILYFWDTTSEQYKSGKLGKPAPYKYPNGAAIGTIFDNNELTSALREAHPPIPEWDTNGHGTACAGVAAGNGRAGPKDSKGRPMYTGVAPDADIIAVRIGTGETMENAYMLNAICEWLQKVAGEKPLVVSCSFGGHAGGHDGYRADELALDARFPLTAKGRAICICAGNEGLEHFHADMQIGDKDKPGLLHWSADGPTMMRIYTQATNADDIDIDVDKTSGVAIREDEDSGDKYLIIRKSIHPLTNQVVISVRAEGGDGTLGLTTASGTPIAADAYFPEGSGAEFNKDCASARNMVGTPGTSSNAITVGSYDWNDRFDRWGEITSLPPVTSPRTALKVGELSGYSSPGYRRFGSAVKPEVTSPGQWYSAPAPMNVAADRDTTGMYQQFNGTSAATPYTAGVVALLFQKNPELTLGEVKSILTKSASPPPKGSQFASPLPNPNWGYGKLDRAAVARVLGTGP